ncbi:hypothetical protein V2J09_009667 [Rumex salicifolius]
MKALFCSISFLLLLTSNKMEAIKSQEDYWKNVMGDESSIPEAIAELIPEGEDPVPRRNGGDSSYLMGTPNWDRLINRDFDAKSIAIIYHPRLHHGHHGDDHGS